MNALIKLSGLVLLSTLYGCTSVPPINPVPRTLITKDHIFFKNYIIGQEQIAYVGEPVVKVKDYLLERYTTSKMRASDDFIFYTGMNARDLTGKKDELFDIIGTTTEKGETYTHITAQNGRWLGWRFFLKDDGTLRNDGIRKNKVDPINLRFIPEVEESISKSAAYTNYELLYSGNNGQSYSLSYREYSPENLARTAFYQDLSYSMETKEIRFKGTRIAVHVIDNEKIVFTVIEDDHKGTSEAQ